MGVDKYLEQFDVGKAKEYENEEYVGYRSNDRAGLTLNSSPDAFPAQIQAERYHKSNRVDHQYDRNLAEFSFSKGIPFCEGYCRQKQQAYRDQRGANAWSGLQPDDYSYRKEQERNPDQLRWQFAAHWQRLVDHLEDGLAVVSDCGAVLGVETSNAVPFLKVQFFISFQFQAHDYCHQAPVYPLNQIALLLGELHISIVGIEVQERGLDRSAATVAGRIRTADYVVVGDRELVCPRLEAVAHIAVYHHIARQFPELHPLIRRAFKGLLSK